jgi:nitrite reductase/ring-hydroxylating ferredoxin subunit
VAISLETGQGLESIFITRRGTEFGAFLNRCPHARWPLDTFDGRFLFALDGSVICAAHGAMFDPISGHCLSGPGQGGGLCKVPLRQDVNALIIGELERDKL